jgi:hypothetical protein
VQKSAHGGHHRSTGYARRFLRSGFNGLFRALPGDEFVLPPSSVDFLCERLRLESMRIHELDTSNGCQDHTALPSAAAFAKRTRRHVHIRRGIDEGGDNAARLRAPGRSRKTALRSIHATARRGHRILFPTFVTFASAPLLGTGRRPKATDLPSEGSGKFSREGLDRFSVAKVICPSG